MKTGVQEKALPARPPSLELLEARLLLDADLPGTELSAPLRTCLDEPVIYMDLNQQEESFQGNGPSAILTLTVSDDGPQAGATASDISASFDAQEEDLSVQPVDTDAATDSLFVGTPAAGLSRLNAVSVDRDAASTESSDLTISPVTHTEVFGGVDVELSTVPQESGFALLGLPASYDLRSLGAVTPVKNQGRAASCWAFATYGSVESTILVDTGVATNLSENHLKNYHGFDLSPTAGGNAFMSQAYLSRWDGPVSEAADPYHDYDDRPSPGGPPQYYVREMLEFDTDSELKDGLMTYGAINTSMYFNNASYNAASNTYYYSGTTNPNHGVTLVGWDDNLVVPGAPGPGAWLIKNSWGTGWGDGGYFWVSYYDSRGANDGSCFRVAVPPDTYQKVYCYDDFGSIGSVNSPYAFNAFTATSDQDLVAVQFWTQADGANYDVRVYDTFSGGALTGFLGMTTGTSTYAGSHTVDLPTPIHLTPGNDFYIWVHITDGGSYPMAVDYRVSGWNSASTASPGQSFYSFDGTSWTDLTKSNSTANFCIKALVTTTAPPEITVTGNGTSIADGDMTPTWLDGTDFDSIALGGPGTSRTFVVQNDGSGMLTLGGLTVPTGFTLTEGLSSSLAPGAFDTFTVHLDTSLAGYKGGHIVIRNDDRDEHPFNFAITGAVVGPEIRVEGNGLSIADGDTTPSTSDGTDFGMVAPGDPSISRTFRVYNDGNAVLTLGPVAVPAGFALTEGLATSLAPGASDTFTVRLDTAVVGTKAGDVSFSTNDYDENPFHFRVTGTVVGGNLALGRPALASTSYTGLPAANVTDGYLSSRWSSQFSDNEWIYVDLGSVYTINRVVLQWEAAYGRGYKLQVSSNASSWSDVYSATTGDGSVDDITLTTPASGRYVRMLGTQRATTYGYSLYELEVYGGLPVNHAPVVSDLSKSGTQDTPLPFAAGDFAGVFADPDAGDSLQKIKITSVPSHGTLTLSSTPVTANQEIPVAQIGALVYTPNSAYTGYDSFRWNGSDGSLYAASEAAVNLSINAAVANLALNKPAAASTSFTGLPASNATDGNPSSRWSSQYSDNEWLYVDLGSAYTIDRVVLRWEAAYGRGYQLQVSSNASMWSDVYSTSTGAGEVEDITLAAPALGRYVRLLGTQRATVYGYSLYELEVYGGPAVNHAPVVSSLGKGTTQDTPLPFVAGDFTGAFADPDVGDSLQTIKITSLPGHGTLTLNSTAVSVSQEITVAQIGTLSYMPAGGYTGSDSFQWNGSDGSLYAASAAAVNLSISAPAANLALNKPVVASTSHPGFPAANATDGDTSSRWSSEFSDSQWLYVDLGAVYTIRQIVLRWEAAYGKGYQLQVSNDASTWSDVYSTTTGAGGVDDVALAAPASGRYVRMLGTQRTTMYGYSLYELEVYSGVAGPEITVLGNGTSIADGDTTPGAGAGTDFGSVVQGGPAPSRTFTVRNEGGSILTLGAVTVPAGFMLTEGLSASLAAGASDTFTVRLDSTVVGTKVGDISFSTNDSDENPFNFRITGTVSLSPPVEITVLGKGVAINDGDTTPSLIDNTDFGVTTVGGSAISHSFLVRNDGSETLLLGSVSVPTGFTLTEGLSGSLAPGTSDTFTVRLETTTPGVKSGEVSFATNDSDENPFNFAITGTVTSPGVPQVTVTLSPLAVAEDGPTNLVYTFTRSLVADGPLTVNFGVGGTAAFATDYTQSGAGSFTTTAGTVTMGASQTTATVTVDPTADAAAEPDETVILTITAGTGYVVGTPAAGTGTIQNDDGAANLALNKPVAASTSYAGFPASNATDGNASSRWSSAFSDSQWIYVDLGSVYTINRVVLRWEAAYGRGYKLQVSNDASTWSDAYSTTTGDGGVDDITLSTPAPGRYVRMLGTQRATTFGYSLYELEVYGGPAVNHAPVVSSFSKSTAQDTPLPFAAADFMGAFTDPDTGDSLQKIEITSLPGHGVLRLNGTAVAVNQEIAAGQIGTLAYMPNSGYTGPDSFLWNGSDGSLYAASAATVNLTISAAAGNLALNKPAVASTSHTGFPASNVTDGNTGSRWSSEWSGESSDSQWLYVDLGSVYTISQVVLRWEAAYGRGYKLQVSSNASTWSDVYSTTTGDGDIDDIPLAFPASGQYVRLFGTQRGTVYGYSLWEFEIYG